MARERFVTRTIKATEVTAICMDVVTVETTIQNFSLTGTYANKELALKGLKKAYETDIFKVVAVQTMTETEELYGMSELDFMKYASKLDKDTRKAIETEETEAE